MGGAMVSLSDDAASAYYNPAGLAGLNKKGISLSASAYQLALESHKNIVDWDTGAGTLQANMESSSFPTFPSSISYVLPLTNGNSPRASHHVLAFSVFVPDYDKMSARLDMPVGDLAAAVNGAIGTSDSTYWVGPSYAVQLSGRFRFGASAFVLAHLTEGQTKFGFKVAEDDGLGNITHVYQTHVLDLSGTSVSAIVQAGAQFDVSEQITIGVSVRSPTLGRLWSSANMLQLSSVVTQDDVGATLGGYSDRIEISKGLRFEQRLPLVASLGVNFHSASGVTVALDGTYYSAVAEYRRIDGDVAYPTDTSGNVISDPDRALDPVELASAKQIVNVNLGVEVPLSTKLMGRFGLFSDFSTVDSSKNPDPIHPKVDKLGVSIGLGHRGERSTTSFGVVYTGGAGKAPGANGIFGAYGAPTNESSVTVHTVTAVLSGSADL